MRDLRLELRSAALAGVAALLSGCAAPGVQFSGRSEPRLAQAAQIASGDRAPDGLRRLGRLSTECRPLPVGELPARARFSDLECSPALLRAALREAAADAGGSFLTEPECRSEGQGSGAARRLTWSGCRAEVWAPAERERWVAPELRPRSPNVDPLAAAAPGAPPFGAVNQAWHVLIEFWPRAVPAQSAPRASDGVIELAFPSVGQLPLGDLSARCDGTCSEDSLRRGLRAAAARMGGSFLIGVRCILADGTPVCVASVSAPEQDEARVAEGR